MYRGDSFSIYCVQPSFCNDYILEEDGDRAERDGRVIAQTLSEIDAWLSGHGFPASNLRTMTIDGNEQYPVRYWQHPGDDSENGWVERQARLNATLRLNYTTAVFEGAEPDTVLLAHEWAHTLASSDETGYQAPDSELRWLDEAIADSIGHAFADPADVAMFPPVHPVDLNLPFYTNAAVLWNEPDDRPDSYGYAKHHYLRFIGQRIGSADTIGHLADTIDGLSDDGVNGMSHLYRDGFADAPFHEYFPRFVAHLNHIAEDGQVAPWGPTGDYTGQYYYAGFAREAFAPSGGHDSPYDLTIERSALDFAADAILVEWIDIAAPSDIPAKERLMVAEFDIRSADRPDDLTLVFEHEVTSDDRYAYMIEADGQMDGPFLRVTNAAADPGNTLDDNTYELGFGLTPVEARIPACMSTNGRAVIEIEGYPAEDIENISLESSAGSTDGMTFMAPGTPGTVALSLVIDDPITRSPTGLAPQNRGSASVELGTVDVQDGVCMIEMAVPAEGFTFTYTADGDFTEYDGGGPETTYVGINRMAMYAPSQGGWVDMSGFAGMMEPDREEVAMLQTLAPDLDFEGSAMAARTPLYMTEAFSWDRIMDSGFVVPGADGGRHASVPCPRGGSGCAQVRAASPDGVYGVRIIYDDARRVAMLGFADGTDAYFSYGGFEIRRPPGW